MAIRLRRYRQYKPVLIINHKLTIEYFLIP